MKARRDISGRYAGLRSRLWLVKAVSLNILSRLPFHERLHFTAQRLAGRHRLDAREMFARAAELFALLAHAGCLIQGARVLEIGTGWFPFTPMLAHLGGAERVFTVDIHPWLRLRNAVKTLRSLGPFLDEFAVKAQCNPDDVRSRYERARNAADSAHNLGDFLEGLNIRYLCPFDLTTSDLGSVRVDVVLSSNVLEHVPPQDLLAIHRTTARMLSDQGAAVHRFNPGDHFSPLTGSTVNFLRYSETAWRRLGGYGLSYHNRLRSCQHAALVREAGLRLALWADALDARALHVCKQGTLPVARPFASMPAEFLCAHYSWFVVRGDEGPSAETPVRVNWIDDLLAVRRRA